MIDPHPVLKIEPEASDPVVDAGDEGGLGDEAPEPESESEKPAVEGPVPAEAPNAIELPSNKKREWMLVIAPGFDYVIGSKNSFKALGGSFRFGGLATSWTGAKGHFLVGGGPMIHYTYLKDPDFEDVIHLATVNGDLILGGGNQRWGVYWHLTLGLGVLSALDAQTNTKITTFGARAGSGVGGFGKINDRFSLGALVDFGWAGGLWVNALITANIHFGRRGDEL
ncbi:MAG: hypothetical protein KC431_21650 [Myxococcales bacterium]|nr:hypothetical protein [Myxococcales bacterium]